VEIGLLYSAWIEKTTGKVSPLKQKNTGFRQIEIALTPAGSGCTIIFEK
jgi:hypothetical protein